jgi:hypothetical protein
MTISHSITRRETAGARIAESPVTLCRKQRDHDFIQTHIKNMTNFVNLEFIMQPKGALSHTSISISIR